ncbi:MAG: tRNA pseudouridine(38-40) synthase TruA [Bacteroidales bacterium]|jgi:tRNA pseudouridine38-40 synthase|nr:tRNA pseudouridine(38-40) synthase TruA [Bacteroidales bacterium]
MTRYFLELSYNGTRFHGWQIQPNASTIQEEINKALSTILREEISVVGAGRTDTGVHSSYYIAHFDSEKDHLAKGTDLRYKLNSFLPKDIAILNIKEVNSDAHARFDAISRTYKYFITLVKDPFTVESSYHLKAVPDVRLMNRAAELLYNYKDFTSFSKLHTDVKTNNCNIMHVKWVQSKKRVILTIKADRFLRNMVRAIVGTLLEVGMGKITIEQFAEIIEKKDRSAAGVSAPPQGLFLTDIEYPTSIYTK